MKIESYTHQVVRFLRTKEVGHKFTSRSLHEDIITTPGERHIPNADLVSATLTRQRRLGAVEGVAKKSKESGGYYEMTLVAPEKMVATFAMKRPGRHDTCKAPRDLKTGPQPDLLTPPGAEQAPNMPKSETPTVHPDERVLSGMDEVKYHIQQAFKAYKKRVLHPLPEIAVKSIPTDILLEELTRRVKAQGNAS